MTKKRGIFLATLLSVVVALTVTSCKNDTEGTTPSKSQLAAPSNPTAYSADTTSVGLRWTPSSNAGLADMEAYQITVKQGSSTIKTETAGKTDSTKVVGGLAPGIYTFEILAKATSSSTSYENSNSVSVTWAPANRLTTEGSAPIDVYEIRSTLGGSGVQFYYGGTRAPRVLSIGVSAGFQQVIDALLDTSSTGQVRLSSAHLNPLLSGQARRTRFSTVETNADNLNQGRSTPPDPSTYTLSSVILAPGTVTTGKIFYAVTSDTNYVRVYVQRDATSSSLLSASQPNRRARIQLSYQTLRNVIYAKPIHGSDNNRSQN